MFLIAFLCFFRQAVKGYQVLLAASAFAGNCFGGITFLANIKMNLSNFANILGLSQVHISNIENDNDNPSDKLLKSICTTFKVNFEWLKNGVGEMDDESPEFDYNNVMIEVKRRFSVNSDVANIELNEILTLVFDAIDKIEDLDKSPFYYNFFLKMIRAIIDVLAFIKEDQQKYSKITPENYQERYKKIMELKECINKILSSMIG